MEFVHDHFSSDLLIISEYIVNEDSFNKEQVPTKSNFKAWLEDCEKLFSEVQEDESQPLALPFFAGSLPVASRCLLISSS